MSFAIQLNGTPFFLVNSLDNSQNKKLSEWVKKELQEAELAPKEKSHVSEFLLLPFSEVEKAEHLVHASLQKERAEAGEDFLTSAHISFYDCLKWRMHALLNQADHEGKDAPAEVAELALMMMRFMSELPVLDALFCMNDLDVSAAKRETLFQELLGSLHNGCIDDLLTPKVLEEWTMRLMDDCRVDCSYKKLLEERIREKLFRLFEEKDPKIANDVNRLQKLLEHLDISRLDKALESLLKRYAHYELQAAICDFEEEVSESTKALTTENPTLSLYQQYLQHLVQRFAQRLQPIVEEK